MSIRYVSAASLRQTRRFLRPDLSWFCAGLLVFFASATAIGQTITLRSLLAEMTDREAVARFPEPYYECLQASSYNRASTNRTQPNQDITGWFADSDGLGFLRTEQIEGRTEWVVMEHQGPGCLTTIWTPFFYFGFEDRKGPNVRIYLDGDPRPVLDEGLIDLVTGKGSLKPPLSALTARAGDSYVPIPFARSCKVTLASKPFYYHINYRAYSAGTAVETFTRVGYEAASAELEKAGRALTAESESDPAGPQVVTNLPSGSRCELNLPSTPGCLRQLSLRISGADKHPAHLRSTVLSMTFDGEQTVWCPVGDFFCSADSLHPFRTWQRRVTSTGTMVCRWIMPYKKSGSIQLLNLGTQPVELSLQVETAGWHWDNRSMHFHANWRPDDIVAGTPFQDWNFIDVRGQGVFVGDAWTVLNPQGSWWGEGDEKIYVDAAWNRGFPTHFGTGTEDYYGWAGGEVPTRKDEFSGPFLANVRVGGVDGQTTGFNICTRTRSLDAIPFKERFVFDMESSFGTDIRNPWNLLGYSAVSFWYGKPGASHNRPGLPALASRPILTLDELNSKAHSIQEACRRNQENLAVVFAEERGVALKPFQSLAANWPGSKSVSEPAFAGAAHPGEFLVFQLGIYPLQDVGPISIRFHDLEAEKTAIPSRALRCLSLSGTNYLGQPFAKEIFLQKGQLQVLWIGVAVPTTTIGSFTGTADLHLGPSKTIPVKIQLNVGGNVLADAGDSVAKNLSRLRWLDSTAGSEPILTEPYGPVHVEGRTVHILGRALELGEDGLPRSINSFFSAANTRIEQTPTEVLAHPAQFVIETEDGPLHLASVFGGLTNTALVATWSSTSEAAGVRIETKGRIDFTGSGEFRLQVVAKKDLEVKDLRLEVPFREATAQYFMGLNYPGGRRPQSVRWKWDTTKRQDCFWLGAVNAGLMLRFKDGEYLRPPVNIYYSFRPLRLPYSWGNQGHGGIDLEPAQDNCILARAYSGPRSLKKGEALDFIFEVYLTPFRTLDTDKQWAVRFTHVGGPGRSAVDEALNTTDAKHGPNVLNVHHASFYSPYINYPYSDDSFPAFCDLVKRAHQKGVRLRVYYTTREITQNMPELFPLHSFNGEIILPGPGRNARTLLHPYGPHEWLTENLRDQFVPAWEAQVGAPYADLDLSVITTPDSRWNNFYLQGLQWLVDHSDFDGMYIDDTALDATSLRRARRILDSRPGRLIDLHTWNHFNEYAGFANNLTIYMEILPYLDRLWLGEGFDANAASADFWLVEMSGLPFGVMSEMLDGANPWRGMLFAETARLPWSGDPRSLWKMWDEFGIHGTEMIPFYVKECPVKTDQTNVLATVYRRKGRSFVALGSWSPEKALVRLKIDWTTLGLNPALARIYAPAIAGFQQEHFWKPGDAVPVQPGQGWFLVLDESTPPAAPAAARPQSQ